MTQEQEPLHERVLEFAPLSIKLALIDLAGWLQEEPFPYTSVTLELTLRGGVVRTVLTGRTSLVEATYARLLKRLKVAP